MAQIRHYNKIGICHPSQVRWAGVKLKKPQLRNNIPQDPSEDLFLYPPGGEVGLVDAADTTLRTYTIVRI